MESSNTFDDFYSFDRIEVQSVDRITDSIERHGHGVANDRHNPNDIGSDTKRQSDRTASSKSVAEQQKCYDSHLVSPLVSRALTEPIVDIEDQADKECDD